MFTSTLLSKGEHI